MMTFSTDTKQQQEQNKICNQNLKRSTYNSLIRSRYPFMLSKLNSLAEAKKSLSEISGPLNNSCKVPPLSTGTFFVSSPAAAH